MEWNKFNLTEKLLTICDNFTSVYTKTFFFQYTKNLSNKKFIKMQATCPTGRPESRRIEPSESRRVEE